MARSRRWRRRLAVGGLVAALGAVALAGAWWRADRSAPGSALPPAETDAPPLHVEWGGCAEVRSHHGAPQCLVDDGTVLRLWIEDPRVDRVALAVDGAAVAAERYAIEGEPGAGLRVRVPAGASELVARVPGEGGTQAAWSLALAPASTERPSAELRRAQVELRRALDERDAAAAGRVAERAFALALADGRSSQAVDVALAVSFQLGRHHLDPRVAEGLLARAEAVARGYPKGRGDLAAYRGLHHWWQGATQDAAESLRDAARHAVRLEDSVLAAEVLPMYAETLVQLGYFEDARGWAHEGLRIVRARSNACELGSVLRTVGWVTLQLHQRGRAHDDPAPFFTEALQIFGEHGACPRPDKLGGARSSLALLALERGRLDEAAAHLDAIDRAALTLDERLHVDDIRMRLALARGDAVQRQAAHARLQASVAAVRTAEARWRLHSRGGRRLELEGDVAGAIESYRRAELELDALVRLQALGIGRGELVDRHHESTATLVSLLVHQGDVGAAWCIVRQDQARRRTAAAGPSTLDAAARAELEEATRRYRREKLQAEALEAEAHGLPRDEALRARQDAAAHHERARALAHALTKQLGRLSPHPRCAELSPPGPGELLLGIYPRAHDWWVFASDARETTVHAVPTPSPDEHPATLAARLLEPVGPRLDAATRVRVLAHRQAQRIDVHRLPWHGAPLGARVPVSYGVELPAAAAPAEPGRRALLVADPTDTLEGAAAEIEHVADRLTGAGWTTTVITVSDAPTPGTMSLAGYHLFHYAGHAEPSTRPEHGGWPPHPGGEAGWAAFLELGPAGRLTVHDVITTRPAPRMAVLAGCRTGALELDSGRTSMALAFLVAGAEQVVASAEAVEDAQGARFARGLYAALLREPGMDLVAAMQEAQRESWAAGEQPAGYRVWVR